MIRLIRKLTLKAAEKGDIKWYEGIVFKNPYSCILYVAPIPLNIIFGIILNIYFRLKKGVVNNIIKKAINREKDKIYLLGYKKGYEKGYLLGYDFAIKLCCIAIKEKFKKIKNND